jgi:hypothetical protein
MGDADVIWASETERTLRRHFCKGFFVPINKRYEWLLGFGVPALLIIVILSADALEGPKTTFVGVLAVVPMLAAVSQGRNQLQRAE